MHEKNNRDGMMGEHQEDVLLQQNSATPQPKKKRERTTKRTRYPKNHQKNFKKELRSFQRNKE